MALTFPLSGPAFMRRLNFVDAKFTLQDYSEISGTRIGQIIPAMIAPSKWSAQFFLAPMYPEEASEIQALIEALGPYDRFRGFNPKRMYPLYDPTGSILGARDPVIDAVNANNKSIRLRNLPVGYRLSVGDMIAFPIAGGRRALHRIVEADFADAAGITTYFEVRPFLRAGTEIGREASLIMPAIDMMIISGSFEEGSYSNGMVQGMSFQALEAW